MPPTRSEKGAQKRMFVGHKTVNSLVMVESKGFSHMARVDAISATHITVELLMGQSVDRWSKRKMTHEVFLQRMWQPGKPYKWCMQPCYSSGKVQKFPASKELADFGKHQDCGFRPNASRSWIDLNINPALSQVLETFVTELGKQDEDFAAKTKSMVVTGLALISTRNNLAGNGRLPIHRDGQGVVATINVSVLLVCDVIACCVRLFSP